MKLNSHLIWQRVWPHPRVRGRKGAAQGGGEENAICTGEANDKKLQALLASVYALQKCHAPEKKKRKKGIYP